MYLLQFKFSKMFCSRTLRSCCMLFRVVPVLFLLVLVLWSYYAFIFKYFSVAGYSSLIEKACIFITYHIFFLMFSWCFYETMKTSPSKPPRQFFISSSKANLIQNSDDDEERNFLLTNLGHKFSLLCRTFTGSVRYCSKCRCLKPDRTHHCSVCKRCVLKMDHHCPWVNNCIGFSNYKYFILFLLYATLYCMFCCLALFSDATGFIWALSDTLRSPVLSVHVVALWLIATMFLCGLLILLSLHCYLVLQNQSTIELFQSQVLIIGPVKRAFNLGCHSNLLQLFGPIKKLWLVPIFSSIGDGITFPLNPIYEDEVRKQQIILKQKWSEEGLLHSNSMSI